MTTLSSALQAPLLGHAAWLWAAFAAVVAALLAFDLGVLHRHDRAIGTRESVLLSAGYVGAALLFGAWLWRAVGAAGAADYLTAYVIEKSLSLDNVFVIAVVFGFFDIPRRYQHRVLFWGILGALVMRGAMIGVGTALVQRFEWILVALGVFLVVSGIKLWLNADRAPRIADHPILRFLQRHLRVTPTIDGHAFVVRRPDPASGTTLLHATPLLLALCLIEFVDLVFAVDSVPAVLAVTTDPFIAYTSNIFAILGLRALYFFLGALIDRFRYLKYSLALVLVFIGAKIALTDFVGKIPPSVSLAVTLVLVGAGILASLRARAADGRPQPSARRAPVEPPLLAGPPAVGPKSVLVGPRRR